MEGGLGAGAGRGISRMGNENGERRRNHGTENPLFHSLVEEGIDAVAMLSGMCVVCMLCWTLNLVC